MSLSNIKISDCHCHSNCSFDGIDSVDALCNQAISLGLYALTVTDHCEASGYADPINSEFGNFSQLIPKSIVEMKAAQKKYKDKLHVYRGLELGQPMQDLKSADTALALDDFDFVLASVHNVAETKDFYWLDYTKSFAYDVLGRYFEEVLETARWNHFDSLAHLTYPLRYITGEHNVQIDLKDFEKIIDEIFLTLIKNEKALEINTSGLRQKIGKTLPDEKLIKRFKSLGGKYMTIGSDAHCVKDLGKGLEQGLEVIKKCGFDAYTIYDKHCPVQIKL